MATRSRRRGSKDLPEEAPQEVPEPVPSSSSVAGQPPVEAEPTAAASSSDHTANAEPVPASSAEPEPTAAAASDLRGAAASSEPPTFAGTLALPERPHSPATEILDEPDATVTEPPPGPPALMDRQTSEAEAGPPALMDRQTSQESADSDASGELWIDKPSAQSASSNEVLRTTGVSFDQLDDGQPDTDEIVEFEFVDNDQIVEVLSKDGSEKHSQTTYEREMAKYEMTKYDSGYQDDDLFSDDAGLPRAQGEDNVDETEITLVRINSYRILSFMCFSVLWVFSAAALMLALTWHYVWVEITEQADLAARSSVDQGSLHASEVLSPATTVLKTLDLAFRGETLINDRDDGFTYSTFGEVLEPFFAAVPDLREVEVADSDKVSPNFRPGSTIMRRRPDGVGTEMMSDRGDCLKIAGGRGCSLEPHRANSSGWFNGRRELYPSGWSPTNLPVTWLGPAFARNLPHEAVCDEVCWSPVYSIASRIAGSRDPMMMPEAPPSESNMTNASMVNVTFDPYQSVIVRVTMEATVLIEVLKQIQMSSRGEALICTDKGRMVASVKMHEAQTADPDTGEIDMVNVWDFPRSWSSSLNSEYVAEAGGKSLMTGDGEYFLSAWTLDAPHNATKTLREHLRIVVAIPSKAYADSVLQSLRYWFIATSALPVVYCLIAAGYNIWLRYLRKVKKDLKDMDIDELKEIARHKKEQIRKHKEQTKEAARRHKEEIARPALMRQNTMKRYWSGRSMSSLFSFRRNKSSDSTGSPKMLADRPQQPMLNDA